MTPNTHICIITPDNQVLGGVGEVFVSRGVNSIEAESNTIEVNGESFFRRDRTTEKT